MTAWTNNSKTLATGTGTVSSSGTAVTGSGTLFTTQLVVGGVIIVGGEARVITVITDATHLTLDRSFSSAASGASFQYDTQWTNNAVT